MSSSKTDDSLLFEQLPVPLVWLGYDNRVERLNAAAETLLRSFAGGAAMTRDVSTAPLRLHWFEQELSRFSNMTLLEHTFEKELQFQTWVRSFKVLLKRLNAPGGTRTLMVLMDITSEKGLEKLVRQIWRDWEAQVEERTAELAWANSSLRAYIDESKRSAAGFKNFPAPSSRPPTT